MSFLFPAMWVVQEEVSTSDSHRLYVALPRHVGRAAWEEGAHEAGGSPFKSVLLSVGAD